MKRSILVTGGAGFIGSRLSLNLLRCGHEVRVLDLLTPQIHGIDPERSPLYRSIAGRVDFQRGDVLDARALDHALQGIDTVVHLAAETGTGQSMYQVRRYVDVNVGGTAAILDHVANGPSTVRKIVVASSRAIYGEGKYRCPVHGVVYPESRSAEALDRGIFEPQCPLCGQVVELLPTDESTPARPSSVYGVTKLSQEQLVLAVGQSLGISAIAFRYQNVYGPGQSLSNPYTGILSIFTTRIRNGNPITIFEDGKESRDFVFIDDVVAATTLGIESDQPIVAALNVGSGAATSVSGLAAGLLERTGLTVPIVVSGNYRLGDIRHNLADLGKVRSILGYEPKVNFKAGLDAFVSWAMNEDVQVDKYEESIAELRGRASTSE